MAPFQKYTSAHTETSKRCSITIQMATMMNSHASRQNDRAAPATNGRRFSSAAVMPPAWMITQIAIRAQAISSRATIAILQPGPSRSRPRASEGGLDVLRPELFGSNDFDAFQPAQADSAGDR